MARRRRKRGRSGKPAADGEQLSSQQQVSFGLTRALAPAVDPEVRQRGEVYFRQSRVAQPTATSERLSAEVRGRGGNYTVTVDMAFDPRRKRSMVSAICSCPFFAEGRGCCKHIWAVLCFADAATDMPFKAQPGIPVGFLKRQTPTPRRLPSVVSAAPGESSRIRAFSARDMVGVTALPKEQESRPQRNSHHHQHHHDQVNWREALKMVAHAQRDQADGKMRPAAANYGADLHYIVDADQTRRSGQLTIQIFRLIHPTGDQGHGHFMPAVMDPAALDAMPSGHDREVLQWFFGVSTASIARAAALDDALIPLRPRGNSFVVADSLRSSLLDKMAATGRLGWLVPEESKPDANGALDAKGFRNLLGDSGPFWHFRLAAMVRRHDLTWIVRGEFRRGGSTVPLGQTLCVFPDGIALFKDRVARIDLPDPRSCAWINALRQSGPFRVDKASHGVFLRALVDQYGSPTIDLPSDSGWTIVTGEPRPKLVFLAAPFSEKAMVLMANYDFDYEAPSQPLIQVQRPPQKEVGRRRGRAPRGALEQEQGVQGQLALEETGDSARRSQMGRPEGAEFQASKGDTPPVQQEPSQVRLVLRSDREREEAFVKDLCTHSGVHPSAGRGVSGADVFVDAAGLADLVSDLAGRGWSIEAEGKKIRAGKSFNIDVRSNMDWLDLRARFDFGGGAAVDLPRILEAMRRGEDRIQLGDGTVGILPESWLKNLEPILRMGEEGAADGSLRYRASHAAFLDVLVSEASEAQLDESFQAYRQKLASFSGVGTSEPDKMFKGELRPYQKQGLGWLEFLDEFAFGGCLADDMGLGKTVQVLAYLQKRVRHAADGLAPTLVVAPTSLIHNWVDEAQRFAPDLKALAYVGAGRPRDVKQLLSYHLVITSYGTMRSDIELLSTISFDYVILDEAQAIKNETTQAAKSARALKARRRLAMSGTPVENRLSELGSLFRFLNPGMIDGAAAFADLFSGSSKLTPGRLATLAKALRPFLLRRTKEQVLPELPGKTESTVYCVLEDEQRKEYDDLAAHYRSTLTKQVKRSGIGKTRMQVLEALLRLRQLACHPGLIDSKRVGEASAKLDLLGSQLEEVIDAGHKALVFSQFTSMLAIVRERLDQRGIKYEYLDGSTVDRKACVERFQNNGELKVFLISLKAGGVGLNLTAADYCFILDPWWNPASEAQAIDRAHRIGQKSHVFAYRLIARGTVEEKILELQAAKRKLVEGIIAADGDVLSDMTAEDLDFLLA